MTTEPKKLTDEEKINLLILCMKADGLNDNLVADGTLGGEAAKGAKVFIEHCDREKNQNLFTTLFLATFISDVGLVSSLNNAQKKAIKLFFAKNGVLLF